jgi:hypothetical protein
MYFAVGVLGQKVPPTPPQMGRLSKLPLSMRVQVDVDKVLKAIDLLDTSPLACYDESRFAQSV